MLPMLDRCLTDLVALASLAKKLQRIDIAGGTDEGSPLAKTKTPRGLMETHKAAGDELLEQESAEYIEAITGAEGEGPLCEMLKDGYRLHSPEPPPRVARDW